MKLSLLTQKINTICPIEGLSETREIWFKPEATEEQKALAYEVYDSWVDPLDPDVTNFVIALSGNTTINNWYESLPKIVCNQLAVYLDKQDFDKVLMVLNSLTIDNAVKTELNTVAEQYNIPVNLT